MKQRNLGELIENRLRSGIVYSQIVKELNVSKSTISYHAKKIGLGKTIASLNLDYDWSEVQKLLDSGISLNQSRYRLGFSKRAARKAIELKIIIKPTKLANNQIESEKKILLR